MESNFNNEKVELSYATLWKSIIRPPRDVYSPELLGDEIFNYKGVTYFRKDYDLLNNRGEILKCSFIEPTEETRPTETMPVVIYLHGNSSSRIEGLKCLPELLKRGINLFVLDFAGCGLSEGEYISLGWHEKDDVSVIVDYVERIPRVGRIGLWGRSMGAATSLLFNNLDNRITCTVYDSPFSDFTMLSKELCKKHASLPNFLVSFALTFIRSSIMERNGLDLYKLNPIDSAANVKCPGFFIHAMNDELISLDHTLNIFDKYTAEKSLNICEGNHNSPRQKHILEKVGEFFKKYLFDIKDIIITSEYGNKKIVKEKKNVSVSPSKKSEINMVVEKKANNSVSPKKKRTNENRSKEKNTIVNIIDNVNSSSKKSKNDDIIENKKKEGNVGDVDCSVNNNSTVSKELFKESNDITVNIKDKKISPKKTRKSE